MRTAMVWVLLLGLAAGGAWAEEPNAGEATVALPSTQTLARNYPVITVEGACGKAAAGKAAAGGCRTVITREEFEELVKAVNPRMTKTQRRQLAQNYGRMLALESEALRRGMDKKPETQALLRYVRASALGGGAFKQVQREASENREADVEKFYRANQASYDRYTFERLFIPVVKQQAQAKSFEQISTADAEASPEKEMKALAEKMHERAAAGENFAALEKEIFAAAGLTGEPGVAITDALRGSLPAEQNGAFDLAPGSVSSIIADGTGYYIYKLVSKKAAPLESVRQQVAVEMQSQRSAAALKKIEHVKVNDTYFDKYDPPPANPDEPEADDD